jgi:hypothetical protein
MFRNTPAPGGGRIADRNIGGAAMALERIDTGAAELDPPDFLAVLA